MYISTGLVAAVLDSVSQYHFPPPPLHLSVRTLRLYFSLLTRPLPSCDLGAFYCDDLRMPSSFSLSIFPLPFILYPRSFLPTRLGLHVRLRLVSHFKTT